MANKKDTELKLPNKARENLAKRFIESLEKGEIPWEKPWHGGGNPQNAITKREYRGINRLILAITAMDKGYADPRWCTYKKAAEQGWQVNKGEKASLIEYWNCYDREDKKNIDFSKAQEICRQEGINFDERFHVYSKVFAVFNVEQMTGVPEIETPLKTIDTSKITEIRDSVLKGMGLNFTEEEIRAYYRPSTDTINMPKVELFKSEGDYTATFLHEAAHSSGHESRLNREGIVKTETLYGEEKMQRYAREELRAEIASTFMSHTLGIPTIADQFDNHASYINGWLNCLKKDPSELMRAINEADKIADYVIEKGELEQFMIIEAEQEKIKEEISIHGIPKSVVDTELLSGSGTVRGKNRIFNYFTSPNKSSKDKITFLKREYGTSGHSGYNNRPEIMSDAKGMRFGDIEDGITLSWNDIAKEISELIEKGKYIPEYIEPMKFEVLENHVTGNEVYSEIAVRFTSEWQMKKILGEETVQTINEIDGTINDKFTISVDGNWKEQKFEFCDETYGENDNLWISINYECADGEIQKYLLEMTPDDVSDIENVVSYEVEKGLAEIKIDYPEV